MLYSYKNQFPEKLPYSIILENGLTLTEVNTFPDEKLKELGFSGPYEIPNHNPNKQRIFWKGDGFLVENLSEDECKIFAKNNQKNYIRFYDLFNKSNLYLKILEQNKLNSILEVCYLKFKLLEQEIRNNFNTDSNIFDNFNIYIKNLYNSYNISKEDELFLDNLLTECEFEFIISESKNIIPQCPQSWVFQSEDQGAMAKKPPIPIPDNENTYIWDEDAYQADNTTGWVLETPT